MTAFASAVTGSADGGRITTSARPPSPPCGVTVTDSTGRSRSFSRTPSASTRSRCVRGGAGNGGGVGRTRVRTRERQVSQTAVTPVRSATSPGSALKAGMRTAPRTTPSLSSTSRSSLRTAPSSAVRAAATAPRGTPSEWASSSAAVAPTGISASAVPAGSRSRCSRATARRSARSSPTTTGRRLPRRDKARANSSGPSGRQILACEPALSTSFAIRTDSPSVRRATGSMTTSSWCAPSPGGWAADTSVLPRVASWCKSPLRYCARGFVYSGAPGSTVQALSYISYGMYDVYVRPLTLDMPRPEGVYACARTCAARCSVG